MREYAATDSPKEVGFTSILGQIDNQIESARKLFERVRQCADRINGSAPTPVGGQSSGNGTRPSALIPEYGDRVAELDAVLSELGGQITRIERVL